MKHRLLLLILFVFAISVAGWAQSTAPSYTVKGVLIDSLTQEGEPYATIKIAKKNAPDKAVKMAVTGANGKFQEKLNVAAGNYIITISSIGKAPIVKEFTLKPSVKEVDLGTMISSEANNVLKGVEVVAQKPLVKVDVDKIEYNIEDDPDSKSNSILEMLRKVPLVTVDGEDNVQVNGSSSFKIHVNGKPNNMMSNNPKEVLKSMPANTIKYIEVITSPGAKYDAEGIGGILNIVTVGSGFEGYTATFRGNANNNGVGAGTYAMVKQGKLTVSANYNYNYNNSPRSYSDSYRENYEPDKENEKYLESESSSKSKGNFQYGNLEASYEIDTLRLLTVAFGMYGSSDKSNSGGNTIMHGADRQNFAYRYRTDNHGKGSWYSINGNIDYQRTSRKNKERMITLSYKINSQPQTNDSYNTYLDIEPDENKLDIIKELSLKNFHSDGKTNTMEQTFQVDYTTPIGKLHTIETGAKYIFRRNSSDNRFYEAEGASENYAYNENRSSEYRHLNHILSAYAGYTLKYKGFTFKPGLRYEQTIQEVKYLVGPGENFDSNFSDLVPSVSLGIKLGKTQNLRGGYNMRIWRPGIWNLNPYFDNQNPMFISQGNPNLKSEKSHSFDLSYSSFTSKFNINLSLRHSFNNNGIERISRLITDKDGEIFEGGHKAPYGALYSTYGNIGKSRETGLNFYLNWNASPKTRIYVNGRGNYSDLRSPAQELHNYGWNASAYGGIQQTLPGKVRLSLNGGGSTPRISLQGKGSGYSYYSLGLSRSFLKEERLSLNIYCSNVLEKYRTYNNHTEGANFISKSSSKYPSRYYGFSISYRLGELKASVKKAARSIDNDDVKGGGGGGGGEGEDHGGGSLAEELDGADAGKGLSGHGVHHHGVNDVADVGAQNDQRQGAQDLGALSGDHPGHVGEHADGAQGDHELHQPLHHGVGGIHHVTDQLGPLTGSQDGAAEHQGDDDDLQHVGLGEGFPHVGGEDGHQGRHEAGIFLGFILGSLGSLRQVGEQSGIVEDVCHHQADDAGDGGGDHEVGHGLPAHGAHLLHVTHGNDAVDHGQQHHGNHDELQQVHEDVAEGLEVIGGEISDADKVENQTDNDAQNQSNKNLNWQGQLFLCFHKIDPSFCTQVYAINT